MKNFFHGGFMLSKPLELFVMIQLQRLDCSVASLLPTRQKAPLRQKLHPPHNLSEPLALFFCKNKQETT
ncbi:hypothetical protein [Bacillus mycoides]|uniref:hypothetical protein n=1 Tax=Bacillus mycoides TaxID=1405 RepID=UPI00130400E7|nr:hypothetical protein [Bacillus mycoides]